MYSWGYPRRYSQGTLATKQLQQALVAATRSAALLRRTPGADVGSRVGQCRCECGKAGEGVSQVQSRCRCGRLVGGETMQSRCRCGR